MLGDRQPPTDLDDVPEVEVAARRGISIVWLIPLVAGAIAIWLGYTTLQQKGPTITITFANAEGLEAGKTKVKYKDVEVGLVDNVAISEDLSRIIVTASMVKGAEHYLNEGTKFWIVRPRIGAGGDVRARHAGLGRLRRGRSRQGRADQELHRPRGAATDQLRRRRAALPAARDQARLGLARLADLLPRHPGRPGARTTSWRTTTRA